MKQVISSLTVIMAVGFATFVGDVAGFEARPSSTLETEVVLHVFTSDGARLRLKQELMSVMWTTYDMNDPAMNPPKLVRGKTYTAQAVFFNNPRSTGRRGGGIGRKFLGDIHPQGLYWRSVEQAYAQAVLQTGDIQKVGRIEVNRMVDGLVVPSSDEGYAASMAIGFMGLFRQAYVGERYVLLGVLRGNGRLEPVSRLSEKMALVIPYAEKILIPSGGSALIDPSVLDHAYKRGIPIQEVDTLDQAFAEMAWTR